jgi:hypothetical protein
MRDSILTTSTVPRGDPHLLPSARAVRYAVEVVDGSSTPETLEPSLHRRPHRQVVVVRSD